ncbi:MAG: chromate transporter [Firmicutes bacterium]|nr:chromate transporter [Bacillota bacterium]
MNDALLLIWEFFKTGLFAIGGGPATIPFLINIANTYPWFSKPELMDMIAISESTPGPVGINMATYAGFKTLGPFGGIVSTLSLTLPSIVIIIIIAKFLEGFQENRTVKAIFGSIKPAVTALIAVAVLNIFEASLIYVENDVTKVRISSIILAIIIFLFLQWDKTKKLHPAIWFLSAAIVGIVLQL